MHGRLHFGFRHSQARTHANEEGCQDIGYPHALRTCYSHRRCQASRCQGFLPMTAWLKEAQGIQGQKEAAHCMQALRVH
eukprot:4943586-Alexandrium_andersonii.AAC.1